MVTSWKTSKILQQLRNEFESQQTTHLLQFLEDPQIHTELTSLLQAHSKRKHLSQEARRSIQLWIQDHPYWNTNPMESKEASILFWQQLEPLLPQESTYNTPLITDSVDRKLNELLSGPNDNPAQVTPLYKEVNHPGKTQTDNFTELLQRLESARLMMVGLLSTSLLSQHIPTKEYNDYLDRELTLLVREDQLTLHPLKQHLLTASNANEKSVDSYIFKLSQIYLPWPTRLPNDFGNQEHIGHVEGTWGNWDEIPLPNQIESTLLLLVGALTLAELESQVDPKQFAARLNKTLPLCMRNGKLHLKPLETELLKEELLTQEQCNLYFEELELQLLPWPLVLPKQEQPSKAPQQTLSELRSPVEEMEELLNQQGESWQEEQTLFQRNQNARDELKKRMREQQFNQAPGDVFLSRPGSDLLASFQSHSHQHDPEDPLKTTEFPVLTSRMTTGPTSHRPVALKDFLEPSTSKTAQLPILTTQTEESGDNFLEAEYYDQSSPSLEAVLDLELQEFEESDAVMSYPKKPPTHSPATKNPENVSLQDASLGALDFEQRQTQPIEQPLEYIKRINKEAGRTPNPPSHLLKRSRANPKSKRSDSQQWIPTRTPPRERQSSALRVPIQPQTPNPWRQQTPPPPNSRRPQTSHNQAPPRPRFIPEANLLEGKVIELDIPRIELIREGKINEELSSGIRRIPKVVENEPLHIGLRKKPDLSAYRKKNKANPQKTPTEPLSSEKISQAEKLSTSNEPSQVTATPKQRELRQSQSGASRLHAEVDNQNKPAAPTSQENSQFVDPLTAVDFSESKDALDQLQTEMTLQKTTGESLQQETNQSLLEYIYVTSPQSESIPLPASRRDPTPILHLEPEPPEMEEDQTIALPPVTSETASLNAPQGVASPPRSSQSKWIGITLVALVLLAVLGWVLTH